MLKVWFFAILPGTQAACGGAHRQRWAGLK